MKHPEMIIISVNDIQEIYLEREREKEGFQCLMDSIEKIGLIIPITVRKNGDKYELIKGQGRLEAHKLLRLDKIKAYVCEEDIPDVQKIENWLVENIVRQHLSPYDKLRMIYYEYQRFKDKDKVVNDFTISKYKVQEAIDFFENASSEILRKVEKKELSYTPAKKLVTALQDPASQNSVADLLAQEKLDKKSENIVIKRAAELEKKKKAKPEQYSKLTVTDLRRDIRYLKEETQNIKDILTTYENMWEMGMSAISKLEKDNRLVTLLSNYDIELMKKEE